LRRTTRFLHRLSDFDLREPASKLDCTREIFRSVASRSRAVTKLFSFGWDRVWKRDLVTGGYALRNAPSLRAALEEVLRMLKPGGTAAFLDFAKSPRRRLQLLLLRLWTGIWGYLLHGNPEVYTYIADSLAIFPDWVRFEALLAELGFRGIRTRLRFAGLIGLTFCRRAAR
jgi:ubiquinone/menaquinone biosynthesis C-methylase UbiE